MQIHINKQMQHTSGNGLQGSACDTYTFEPGIMSREGGHYYKNVCGTLRANAGDNRMAMARMTTSSLTEHPSIKAKTQNTT